MDQPAPTPRLVCFVVGVVTSVWAIVGLVSLVNHDYQALIYVSPPMGLVVGYVTGVKIVRRVNGVR